MGFYPNPIKLVGYSNSERTITVLDGENQVHEFEFGINTDFATKLWSVKQNIWGGFYSAVWAALRKGREVPTVKTITHPSGFVVKIDAGRKQEIMKKYDSQSTPDKKYRFTAIATTAKSLTYHGERQWFKTAADCRSFCEDVFGKEFPKRFELAIVEAKQVVEPKQVIPLTTKILSR